MALTQKKITAVVTCYNEEKIIPVMYQRLKNTLTNVAADHEIIYINDASPDNSEAILDMLSEKDSRLKVISFSRTFGIHRGFSCGLDYATGDAVVLLDGDLQDPPELIEEFVKKWMDGFEVIYGHRIKRKETILRRFSFKLFYRIFARLSYIPIPRDAGEFALLDRKVVESIKLFGERDRFLRGIRAWAGFRQTGVPYIRESRYSGKSTNNFKKNIQWAKLAIFSFSYAPLGLIHYLAISVLLVSGLGILYDLLSFIFIMPPPSGISITNLLVLFFSGTQLLCMSILAEYIGRIFEEIKRRPLYLISKTRNITTNSMSRPADFSKTCHTFDV